MKRNAANKPGSLTCVFKGGPVGMHSALPTRESDPTGRIPSDVIEDLDGLVMVVASHESWRLVLTSSRKLGWVDAHDLGVGIVPGTVYHIDFTK